jgi:hypothetical protein
MWRELRHLNLINAISGLAGGVVHEKISILFFLDVFGLRTPKIPLRPGVDIPIFFRARSFFGRAHVWQGRQVAYEKQIDAEIVLKVVCDLIDSAVLPGYADSGPGQRASLVNKS